MIVEIDAPKGAKKGTAYEGLVWESYTNSDTTEGRGADVHIGYFTQKSDAQEAGKGRGVMGTPAPVRPVYLRVHGTLKEFMAFRDQDIRRRALDKLNHEERRVLGLAFDLKED